MIPAWTMSGVLPPVRKDEPGHSLERSPYCVPLWMVVEQFSTSPDRVAILEGLLDYRTALHQLGVFSGFQWLDGSFLEDVETLESRPPKDVDVVTYFHLPPGDTQQTLLARAGGLFSNPHVKSAYSVDAYPYVLGEPVSAPAVRQISYWYSMWSHRRNGIWKGFIQVDLDPQQDADARQVLWGAQVGGATP